MIKILAGNWRLVQRIFNLFFLSMLVAIAACNKNCFESLVKKQGSDFRISKRITEGKLDNGVRYFYLNNTTPKGKCLLRLHIAAGSFNETDHELGMAHMVEHLAFDDRSISKNETLAEWFQEHGMSLGPDANAYTSTDHTVYQIDLPKCDQQEVTDALSILRNFANGLQFKDSAVSKEKNIIDAEEREFKNTKGKIYERTVAHLLSGTFYVSRPVLGKKDARDKFTKESVSTFYREWYQPNNFTVVLVGDFSELKPKELIVKAFADIATNESQKIPVKSPHPDHRESAFIVNEPEFTYVETVYIVQPKKLEKPVFSKAILKDRIAFDLALAMLRNTLKSKAKGSSAHLREPSLQGILLDKGQYEMSLSVAGSQERFEQSFKDAFSILREAEVKGFFEEDFQSAKEIYKDGIEQWIAEEDTWSSGVWTNRIIDHINLKAYANDARDYHTWVIPVLASISAKDCQKALKEALKSGNQYIFVIGALEDSKENVKKLKNMLASAKAEKISIKGPTRPLEFHYHIADCSPPDQDIKLTHLRNVDSYILNLSNNFSVILKPTKFKNDDIQLRLVSDSHYLAMPEPDFITARIAMSLLAEGGLKKHPPEEIPELLKDKSMFISLSLLDNHLQASASTRNKDLRFTLELLRAYITDPLYADSALTQFKDRVKAGYAMLEHDMWAPLQHDFVKAMTSNDYRVGRTPLANIVKITREELLAWHQKYLSTKILNLVVVGDFDLSRTAKEIACVFGGLQKGLASPHTPARPMGFKPGVNETYNVKTKDETSKIAVRYPLDFPKLGLRDHRFIILRNVLQETLRQKLREKKQITYSPSVDMVINTDPLMENWLDVVISVPKSDAETIRKKIITILGKLSKSGINEAALKKAKEPYLAKMTELQSDNSFYAEILSSNFSKIHELHWLNTVTTDINKIKIGDINQLLKKYFLPKNASTAVINAVDG